MFSNDSSRPIEEKIKIILERNNFSAEIEHKITDGHYIDLIAVKNNQVLLFEVKSKKHKIDQFDLIQLQSYEDYLKTIEEYAHKEIKKCIITSGSISSYMSQIKHDFNIELCKIKNDKDIERAVSLCIAR